MRKLLTFVPALFASAAILSASQAKVAKPPATTHQTSPLTMGPDQREPGSITITNHCKGDQEFRVAMAPKVGWIQFTRGFTATVGGGKASPFQVTFDTADMKAGDYKSTLTVTCEDCGDKCLSGKNEFEIDLTVTGDSPNAGGGTGASGGGVAGGGAAGRGSRRGGPAPVGPGTTNPAGADPKAGSKPTSEVGPNSGRPPGRGNGKNETGPTANAAGGRPTVPGARGGDAGTPANGGSAVAKVDPPVEIPASTPSEIPLLPLILGGLVVAGGVVGLMLRGGTPTVDTPAKGAGVPGSTPVRDVVPQPSQTPTQDGVPPGRGRDVIPGNVPTEYVPGSSGQDHVSDGPGNWGASLDLPAQDVVLRPAPGQPVGGVVPLTDVIERHAFDKQEDPPGSWGAALDLPAGDYLINPAGGITGVPGDLVKLGPPPPYPGSSHGEFVEYPAGREPRLYVDPKTGEQRWIHFGKRVPDGWVVNDQLRPIVDVPPGSDYVSGSAKKIVHVPDGLVKLQPPPPFPGTESGMTVTYIPGQEPVLYYDPTTGEQRWVMFHERRPVGWLRQDHPAIFPAKAPPKPPPAVVVKTETPPPAPAPPVPQEGYRNEGGGRTVSKGSTPENLAKANEKPTDEERARAKPDAGAGPDDYAEREKQIREGMVRWWEEPMPSIGVDPFRPDPVPLPPKPPYVPKTPLDQERIDYIDRMIEAAKQLGNKKAIKLWSEIRRDYEGLNSGFLGELDDLILLDKQLVEAYRNHEGPSIPDWINYLLGPEGRTLDQYGGIAKAARQVAEHQYLIYLYRTQGATAVNKYRRDQARDTFYQGMLHIVEMGVQIALTSSHVEIQKGTPELPNTFRPPKMKGGPPKDDVPPPKSGGGAAATEEKPPAGSSSKPTLKYTPEDEAAAGRPGKPTLKYTPEDEAAAGRSGRSEAPTQKMPPKEDAGAKQPPEQAGKGSTQKYTRQDEADAAKSGQPKKMGPEQEERWRKSVDDDWKKWEQEDAAAKAQGKDAVDETFGKKKATFLPKEEPVPPGKESPGVPDEERPIRPLTPEERDAWKKSVDEDHAKVKWLRPGGPKQQSEPAPQKAPPQKNVETKPIRGGDTKDVPPKGEALPETRTRVVKPVTEEDAGSAAPKQDATPKQEAPPMKLPQQKGVAFGPRKAILEKYGPTVERARAAAGGPSGSCEKAKLSVLEELEGTGATGQQQKIGPLDHEAVFTNDGHVIDPVARQVIDKGIVTETQLADRNLLKAVNDGIFTRAQWEDFRRLGGN